MSNITQCLQMEYLLDHTLEIPIENLYEVAKQYPDLAITSFAALLPKEMLEDLCQRAPMHAMTIRDLLSKEMNQFITDEAVKRHFGGKKDELLPSDARIIQGRTGKE